MALAKNRVAHARAFASHVNGAHLGFRIQTVGHHAAADHGHDRGNVLVVGAQHRHAVKGQTTDEVDEGLLQTDEIVPAITGDRLRKLASDSSASATMYSPVPSLALAPELFKRPPIT